MPFEPFYMVYENSKQRQLWALTSWHEHVTAWSTSTGSSVAIDKFHALIGLLIQIFVNFEHNVIYQKLFSDF